MTLTAAPRRRLPVEWSDLLDAYRWYVVQDPATQPCLHLESGHLTCPAAEGLESPEDATERLAPLPLKSPLQAIEQRMQFAGSLCDPQFRKELTATLSDKRIFKRFDEVLATEPIEETRWREEERNADLETLLGWLGRLGVEPDPMPSLMRTVIAFPLRRE